MREAPSIVIIEALLEAGASIHAFDPQAADVCLRSVFGDRITYGRTPYDVLSGARGLLVITDWAEFRAPNFSRVQEAMAADPVVFDGRNLYEPARMRARGFGYYGIGRGTTSQTA